jgi:shikimate kinase
MGTGKTVTGQLLAKRTGRPLVDMDELIVERNGKSIPEIFAQDGEPAFRAMERALARELSQRSGLIISTGGGIVLNPDNLADFARTGMVVCLTASPETIFRRLQSDTSRPLLSGDKRAQIAALLERRQPLYAAIAHQIDGDQLDPAGRTDAILRLYALESAR